MVAQRESERNKHQQRPRPNADVSGITNPASGAKWLVDKIDNRSTDHTRDRVAERTSATKSGRDCAHSVADDQSQEGETTGHEIENL
jgi:hypothetical protein